VLIYFILPVLARFIQSCKSILWPFTATQYNNVRWGYEHARRIILCTESRTLLTKILYSYVRLLHRVPYLYFKCEFKLYVKIPKKSVSRGDKARWIFLDLRWPGVVYETHRVLYTYTYTTPQGVTCTTLLFIYRFFYFTRYWKLLPSGTQSIRLKNIPMLWKKKWFIKFAWKRYDTGQLYHIILIKKIT
jgi:hypothetical protein